MKRDRGNGGRNYSTNLTFQYEKKCMCTLLLLKRDQNVRVEGRSMLDVAATNLFGGGCLKKFGLAYKIYMTMLGLYLYDCRVYKQCTGSLPLFQFFQSRFMKWLIVENSFGQTRPSSVKHCRNIVCTLDNCKMFFKPLVGPKNTFFIYTTQVNRILRLEENWFRNMKDVLFLNVEFINRTEQNTQD